MSRATLLIIALLVGLSCGVAGCGSSDESAATTTTSATEAWADGLCGAVGTWYAAIAADAQSLKSDPTRSGVQNAATQAKDATSTLTDELGNLGKPDLAASEQAKSIVDTLSSQLSTATDQMQTATENLSGATAVLGAVSTVSGTLAQMSTALSKAWNDLKSLQGEGKSELESAFKSSSSCSDLQSTISSG